MTHHGSPRDRGKRYRFESREEDTRRTLVILDVEGEGGFEEKACCLISYLLPLGFPVRNIGNKTTGHVIETLKNKRK